MSSRLSLSLAIAALAVTLSVVMPAPVHADGWRSADRGGRVDDQQGYDESPQGDQWHGDQQWHGDGRGDQERHGDPREHFVVRRGGSRQHATGTTGPYWGTMRPYWGSMAPGAAIRGTGHRRCN